MENRLETVKEIFNRLDSTTFNHSVRVMALAMEYEEYAGLDHNILSQAALVHDIGKVYVSNKILDKIGRLSKLEHLLVDLHPYIGYSMLKERGIREDIARIVLYHHGFKPPMLSEVSMEYEDKGFVNYASQVLRTIDAFEALTSDRPYHRGISAVEATNLLKKQGFDENDGYYFLAKVAFSQSSETSAVLRGNYLNINDSLDDILKNWESDNCE